MTDSTIPSPESDARRSNGSPVLIGVLVVALALGLGVGVAFYGLGTAPDRGVPQALIDQMQAGTLLPTPKPLAPFQLTDQNGEALDQEALRGHWTIFAIGYTHCPDVCPMTMATIGKLKGQLAGTSPEPSFLLVTIDPARDTPEVLQRYLANFKLDITAATGAQEQIDALTTQLGLMVRKVPASEMAQGEGHAHHHHGGGDMFDHSAPLLLIDPEVRLAAIFSTPHDIEQIAEDYRRVAAER